MRGCGVGTADTDVHVIKLYFRVYDARARCEARVRDARPYLCVLHPNQEKSEQKCLHYKRIATGFLEIMSPLVVFKKHYYKFLFFCSEGLTESCKNSTKSSRVPFTQLPTMVVAPIILAHCGNQGIDASTTSLSSGTHVRACTLACAQLFEAIACGDSRAQHPVGTQSCSVPGKSSLCGGRLLPVPRARRSPAWSPSL